MYTRSILAIAAIICGTVTFSYVPSHKSEAGCAGCKRTPFVSVTVVRPKAVGAYGKWCITDRTGRINRSFPPSKQATFKAPVGRVYFYCQFPTGKLFKTKSVPSHDGGVLYLRYTGKRCGRHWHEHTNRR